MTTIPAMFLWMFIILLLFASWKDLTTFRIPNWIPVVIFAMFPIYVLGARVQVDTVLWHGLAFAVTMAVGFALFAWNKVGGGDVKLLAVLALWAGWGAPLVNLIAVTTILGGLLSLVILLCRATPIAPMVSTLCRAHGWNCAVFEPGNKNAPYGIAISAAFLILAFEPM